MQHDPDNPISVSSDIVPGVPADTTGTLRINVCGGEARELQKDLARR